MDRFDRLYDDIRILVQALRAGALGGVSQLVYNKLFDDTAAAEAVIAWLHGVNKSERSQGTDIDVSPTRPQLRLPEEDGYDIRLFSWKLSYFSGKIRG